MGVNRGKGDKIIDIMPGQKKNFQSYDYHRFIDEAGDMTFFGKGRLCVLGQEGVSKAFILGMAAYKEPLMEARTKIAAFCHHIADDQYFNTMPSVAKRIAKGDFYLHAKDDPQELRYEFLKFMAVELNFTIQAVVARKKVERFVQKHNSQEREFYADMLSRLLKDKANYPKLVINIAERGSCTRGKNLEEAIERIYERYKHSGGEEYKAEIKFNVQQYDKEPLLAVIDYSLWTIQRVFERGEDRHYLLIRDNIHSICDLYDPGMAGFSRGEANFYGPNHPLSKDNKIH
jgi:hypothetical protein